MSTLGTQRLLWRLNSVRLCLLRYVSYASCWKNTIYAHTWDLRELSCSHSVLPTPLSMAWNFTQSKDFFSHHDMLRQLSTNRNDIWLSVMRWLVQACVMYTVSVTHLQRNKANTRFRQNIDTITSRMYTVDWLYWTVINGINLISTPYVHANKKPPSSLQKRQKVVLVFVTSALGLRAE